MFPTRFSLGNVYIITFPILFCVFLLNSFFLFSSDQRDFSIEEKNSFSTEEKVLNDTVKPPNETYSYSSNKSTQFPLDINEEIEPKKITVLRPLQEALNEFNWSYFIPLNEIGNRLPTGVMEAFTMVLVPYLEEPPKYPIEIHTRTTPLSSLLDCEKHYESVLTGKRREQPVKVFDFISFSCELDLLEIRLYELNESVDYFVILESTLTHRGVRKPLFYARNIERFKAFRNKIIHIVMDDSDVLRFREENQIEGDDWRIELLARKLLWTQFIEAMDDNLPSSDSILIHGDADEIPSGITIYHLKHCELKEEVPVLSFGLYNYRFNFKYVLGSEMLPYPHVQTFQFMKNKDRFCRGCNNCQSTCSIVLPYSGAHISYYASIPFLIWKHLSLAEGGTIPRNDLNFLKNVTLVENALKKGKRICCPNDNIPLTRDMNFPKPEFIPWFAQENRKRFPSLFQE